MAAEIISAKDLNEWILDKKEFFIFDVRNESDFNDWKIEGANIDYLNIPYFDLLDGVEGAVEKLPKDKDIVVVCAKEGSSQMVAEMLDEAGVSTRYLEGGMKGWSEY